MDDCKVLYFKLILLLKCPQCLYTLINATRVCSLRKTRLPNSGLFVATWAGLVDLECGFTGASEPNDPNPEGQTAAKNMLNGNRSFEEVILHLWTLDAATFRATLILRHKLVQNTACIYTYSLTPLILFMCSRYMRARVNRDSADYRLWVHGSLIV